MRLTRFYVNVILIWLPLRKTEFWFLQVTPISRNILEKFTVAHVKIGQARPFTALQWPYANTGLQTQNQTGFFDSNDEPGIEPCIPISTIQRWLDETDWVAATPWQISASPSNTQLLPETPSPATARILGLSPSGLKGGLCGPQKRIFFRGWALIMLLKCNWCFKSFHSMF